MMRENAEAKPESDGGTKTLEMQATQGIGMGLACDSAIVWYAPGDVMRLGHNIRWCVVAHLSSTNGMSSAMDGIFHFLFQCLWLLWWIDGVLNVLWDSG